MWVYLMIEKKLYKVLMELIIVLIVTPIVFPLAFAVESTSQDIAMRFIQEVLPVDLSKYSISVTGPSQPPSVLGMPPLPDEIRVTLNSVGSTLEAICLIRNNVLGSCHLSTKAGQVISDRQYVDVVDAARSFLERYQNYTKIDSTDMIAMLANVDATKDSTVLMGNTKFTVSNFVFGTEITLFSWIHSENGADYTKLEVGFQKNGVFDALFDDRAIYSIGDTTVNVTDKQAIDIAMEYLKTYSYSMSEDWKVSGFNITEDRTTTELLTTNYPKTSTVLNPYWSINLYLNKVYPGSVHGFMICIWANSGEVFYCGQLAYGGVDPTDTSGSAPPEPTSESDPSPEPSVVDVPPQESSITDNPPPENTSATTDILYPAAIAIAVIGLTVASAAVLKKRKK